MQHPIVAAIYAYEGAFYPVVFQEDRLIYPVNRALDPDDVPGERDAIALLREHYPDVPIIEGHAFSEQYQSYGYYKPHRNSLLTPFLCSVCQGPITLNPRSRGAGRNTPYGALGHCWYDCLSCQSIYDCQSQERQYGTSHEWWYQQNGKGPFIECDEPASIPNVNPFHFYEVILGKKKEQ